MSVIDSTSSLDPRINEGIFDRRSIETDFNTPKISSSVSFNNLNQNHIPRHSKSPFNRNVIESINHAVTPHPNPSKKLSNPSQKHLTEEDMHNTWKKAPRISKELPSAFGGSFPRPLSHIKKYLSRIVLTRI
jgi:hypothetical protein